MLFMAASFAVMVVGAARENAAASDVAAPELPEGMKVLASHELADAKGNPFDAGRLTMENGRITVRGVLAHYVVQELFEKAAPPGWVDWVKGLDEKTASASHEAPVVVPVDAATFEMPLDAKASAEQGIAWDSTTRTLRFDKHADAEVRTKLAAAAPPKTFHDAIAVLAAQSLNGRTTGLWLLLSYLFATLGELCLSPVGLSMVTKLAPRRFASLFMGVWLLTSSVAQYAGGSIGESWGRVAPITYFWLFVWTSLAGAALLAVLVWPLKRLMHDVH